MTVRCLEVALTTAADGTVTGYSRRTSGKVHSIHYEKHATTPFADGVDFTITAETTGETLWAESNVNASAVRYPRAPTHSQAGIPSLYAALGTAVQDRPALGNDRVKIAIAQGGSSKIGTFYILVDD